MIKLCPALQKSQSGLTELSFHIFLKVTMIYELEAKMIVSSMFFNHLAERIYSFAMLIHSLIPNRPIRQITCLCIL